MDIKLEEFQFHQFADKELVYKFLAWMPTEGNPANKTACNWPDFSS